MSIMRHDENHFTLITAAAAQWHDREWLQNHLDEGLILTDHTEDYSTLIVTGPESREVLSSLSDADFSSPWLSHQPAVVAGRNMLLARVSFAGELGWEVHGTNADIPSAYAAIIKAGAKPFGMYALNSLRLEKGYRAWKGDLSTDYTVLQGGLERFVKWDKEEFRGKSALQAEKQRGVTKRFATLLVEAADHDAPYMSTLWKGDEVVGETTSGGWGYRIDKSIALGMIKAELATPGTELDVEIYGRRHKAVVQGDQPLWDPANERIRA